ncbi:phage virion morphogenesis protein [Rhodothalassium salexigens]|uniref:phage virion morphogenesis protein n=1 Tax=Rhodothalassium salexigens TaxID=1086 RepID=UPI00191392F9|nr:phage virion morphogenesis protein [Rhodothalassium salexigens]MBK5910133.1 phage virion morphogenesis protein [Rhodothalassium salexigens]MBK5920746.1 phage virion morphogenesis protein [Rhodothalassium salexigens]
MTDEKRPLDPVDAMLEEALRALSPRERQALFRDLVRELRRRTQARITRQEAPDGTPWPPRKRDARGRVRSRAKMLTGLRHARRLHATSTPDGASLGYRGSTGRLAAVHHHGLRDRVSANGPTVAYPARPLLGLSPADRAWLRDRLLAHVTTSEG